MGQWAISGNCNDNNDNRVLIYRNRGNYDYELKDLFFDKPIIKLISNPLA